VLRYFWESFNFGDRLLKLFKLVLRNGFLPFGLFLVNLINLERNQYFSFATVDNLVLRVYDIDLEIRWTHFFNFRRVTIFLIYFLEYLCGTSLL